MTAFEPDRPIRVVYFGGAFLEYSAIRFLSALEAHPLVDFVGGVCQSEGFGLTERVRETVQRRNVMAPFALAQHAVNRLNPMLREPRQYFATRRQAQRAIDRLILARHIHAPEVLEHVRSLKPDLGIIYGSPILKPELFDIPRLGTLGIHHGTLPEYRGKKTTFWEVYNGEGVAGISIQFVRKELDAGDIVMQGEVPIGRHWWWTVDRRVHQLGVDLYLDAILAVRNGTATRRPQQRPGKPGIYHEPRLTDFMRLAGRHARESLTGRRASIARRGRQ